MVAAVDVTHYTVQVRVAVRFVGHAVLRGGEDHDFGPQTILIGYVDAVFELLPVIRPAVYPVAVGALEADWGDLFARPAHHREDADVVESLSAKIGAIGAEPVSVILAVPQRLHVSGAKTEVVGVVVIEGTTGDSHYAVIRGSVAGVNGKQIARRAPAAIAGAVPQSNECVVVLVVAERSGDAEVLRRCHRSGVPDDIGVRIIGGGDVHLVL